MRQSSFIIFLFLSISPSDSLKPDTGEYRLFRDLFERNDYNPLVRPVTDESRPVVVIFSVSLQQIIDVDEKQQLLIASIWLEMAWNDSFLVWNPKDYKNATSLRIPADKMWRPDILLYNSADATFDSTYKSNIVVTNTGLTNFVPPGLFKSTCHIDITWFPFDEQGCQLKFGSWTYDGFQIDLQLKAPYGNQKNFLPNGEWTLLSIPAQRNVLYYSCCPEPYYDATFTIRIRRRKLYFIYNIVAPAFVIALLTMLSVSDAMPPTSETVPLIGMYFSCVLLMCSMSVVFTVLVLNIYHRTPQTHEMPWWVERGICVWLAWVLRIQRPGRVFDRSDFLRQLRFQTNFRRLRKKVECQQINGSVVRNIIDVSKDDICSECNSAISPAGHVSEVESFPTLNEVKAKIRFGKLKMSHEKPSTKNHVTWQDELSIKLRDIVRELRYINKKLRQEQRENKQIANWQFAAHVIDRLCLIIFVTFTFVSSTAILFSAPNVF